MKDKILKEIREMVEGEFGYSLDNKTREQRYVLARAVYYKLCYHHTKIGLTDIGRSLDKHHATVLHGLKVFDSFKIQPAFYKHELDIYHKISDVLKEEPVEEITIMEKIKREKEEVLKIHQEISEKYLRLKEKHNRMLKFYSKYEKKAVEHFVEL